MDAPGRACASEHVFDVLQPSAFNRRTIDVSVQQRTFVAQSTGTVSQSKPIEPLSRHGHEAFMLRDHVVIGLLKRGDRVV